MYTRGRDYSTRPFLTDFTKHIRHFILKGNRIHQTSFTRKIILYEMPTKRKYQNSDNALRMITLVARGEKTSKRDFHFKYKRKLGKTDTKVLLVSQ